MSITTIKNEYQSLGQIRYFLSDRCMNSSEIQKFNHGKIKADELVTFDCGLMELKEILKADDEISAGVEQLLAVIVRPEIEINYELEQKKRFTFCGYDLVDIDACISTITNCGTAFSGAIDYNALNEYWLLPSYREAVNTQLNLNKMYPDASHAYCEIVEIWRWLVK